MLLRQREGIVNTQSQNDPVFKKAKATSAEYLSHLSIWATLRKTYCKYVMSPICTMLISSFNGLSGPGT